ncbi:hypothetical protein CPB83DRAFT_496246 [Crepidotus variabilis]|uniref:Uncharacterized protein n=1 Tax=Crepidotus variabilis TaxID=179855 RepID=A0A9P6ECD1_9AGAR|nr:hypothetical protein CPB83DRAFT_496246 [Crepidotus variabilis]
MGQLPSTLGPWSRRCTFIPPRDGYIHSRKSWRQCVPTEQRCLHYGTIKIWKPTFGDCESKTTRGSATAWNVSMPGGHKVDAINLFGSRIFILKRNQIVQWAPGSIPGIRLDSSPVDLLRARQTCKHIRDASLRHTVWAQIMYQIMLQHNIPAITFLPKLNQQTLEHLSLSPRKFRRKLEAGFDSGPKTISPVSAQYALYDPPGAKLAALGIENLLPYQWLDVCPGGRFLFTFRVVQKANGGSRTANFIQLWDLGTVGALYYPRVAACLVNPSPGAHQH